MTIRYVDIDIFVDDFFTYESVNRIFQLINF